MCQMNVFPCHKAFCLNHRPDMLINGSGRYGGLHDNDRSFGTYLQHILHCFFHKACIHLFACLVIGSGNCHNIEPCTLIFMRKPDSLRHGLLKQLVQPLFLKSGLSCIQCVYQCSVIVCPNHFHSMRREHQCGWKPDITKSYYINHLCHPPSVRLLISFISRGTFPYSSFSCSNCICIL